MRNSALALCLTAPLVCQAAGYVAAGVVVDSQTQKPLANVRVSLAATGARDQKLEQVTQPDGRFSFAVTRPGKYGLIVNKPGYPVQSYRQSTGSGFGSAIVVRDDQDTSHIVFQARRGAPISGTIKDEQSEPVANATVTVFQSMIAGGERRLVARGQTSVNAAGEFRVANLLPGTYYVSAVGRPWFAETILQQQQMEDGMRHPRRPIRETGASPPPILSDGLPLRSPPQYSSDPDLRGTAFLATFYPEARSVDDATPLRLNPGSEAEVSIALPFSKAVTINGSIAGEPGAGVALLFKRVRDQGLQILDPVFTKDGTFQFKNVPAGTYELRVLSQSSGPSSWNIGQELVVGASDVDLSLKPSPMGSLSGAVLFEGERPASTSSMFIILRNEQGIPARFEVDPSGNFYVYRIALGRYEVTAGNAEYSAAYFNGPNGDRLPLTIEITSSEPIHRDLTLTRATSVIEGTAEKAGSPQVGALVVLLPKDASAHGTGRAFQTESDGSYSLARIPAGDYLIIALSEEAEIVYGDPKVAAILRRAAKPVHVDPGDRLDIKVDVVDTASLHLP